MKRQAFVVLMASFVAGLPVSALGQAIVEHALGTAASGVAGAAAGKGTAKSVGAVFDKVGKTLEQGGKSSPPRPAAAAAPRSGPAAAKAPASGREPAQTAQKQDSTAPPATVDLSEITEGLERQDLVEKFGKPSMKITNMDSSGVVEKYWYRAAGRESVVVTLRNGKVAAVSSSVN